MRFFKKRWHSIPVALLAVLLALVLVTGGVFAAGGFNFLSFTTVITVDEPLAVEYNLQGNYGGDSNWHLLPDQDSLTIEGSAGDVFSIDLRINNRANSALTVNTAITGDISYFTFSGFPAGTPGNVAASDWVDVNSPEWGPTTTTISINGNAPTGTWSVTFTFTRS